MTTKLKVRLLCGFTGVGRRGAIVEMAPEDAKRYFKRGTVELVDEDEEVDEVPDEDEEEGEGGDEQPKPKPKSRGRRRSKKPTE